MLYSRKEAARELGVSLTTLDELRREGKIGYLQKGPNCKVQFTQAHIKQYLKSVDRKSIRD